MLSMTLISSRTHFLQRGKKEPRSKVHYRRRSRGGEVQVRTPGWGRVEAKGGRPFWNRVGSMCRGVRFGPMTATPSGDEANALPKHPDAAPEHQGACMQRRRKGQPGALKPSAGRGCPSLDKADCVFRSLSLARGGGALGSTPAAWPPPRHPGPT